MIPTQEQLNDFKFIKEFKDNVFWYYISRYQKLSENLIIEFKGKVIWDYILIYQILSEDFIREFKDYVYWSCILRYQKLSEGFIREFKDKVHWDLISIYKTLSENFIKEFNLIISEGNWIYKSKEFKLDYIKNYTNYEVIDNKYILAYKSTKFNRKSSYKPNFYHYEVGQIYSSNCDCNMNDDNSFGLYACTKEKSIEHCNQELYLVKIFIDDIGCITKKIIKLELEN